MSRMNRQRVSAIATLLCFIILQGSAQAELLWNVTKVEKTADAADEYAVADFTVRNTGKRPLRIIEFHPSCSCIETTSQFEEILPGHAKRVSFKMLFLGRTGLLRGTMAVKTNDLQNEVTTLDLHVTVPAAIIIEPRRVAWKLNAPCNPKIIKIAVFDARRVNIELLDKSSSDFDITITHNSGGKIYNLEIKPKSTEFTTKTILRIRSTVDGRGSDQLVFAMIN
jgi:hypothetical protein